MNDFNYRRRHSSTVQIGNVPLGGDNPIRIQSMTSTSTLDTDASVAQCRRIFDAGADYVRLTAQGVREAHNIGEIRAALHATPSRLSPTSISTPKPHSRQPPRPTRCASIQATLSMPRARSRNWSIPTRSMPRNLRRYAVPWCLFSPSAANTTRQCASA